MKLPFLLYIMVLLLTTACKQEPRTVQQGEVVNVYTACYQKADDQLFRNFENATGIKVNLIYGNAGTLIDRLKQQGEQPEADLLILRGVCYLEQAKKAGLLQSSSYQPDYFYPRQFQDSMKYWYALTYDPFVIAYLQDSMANQLPSTYAALAKQAWQGTLTLPTDQDFLHALTVSMLADKGEEMTLEWLRQCRKNMVSLKNASHNQENMPGASAYLALINASQYFTTMKAEPVSILFPDQAGEGAYATVTGVSVLQNAANPDHAKRFLVYLLDTETQRSYARSHHEYPASAEVQTPSLLQELGSFKLNSISLAELGKYCDRAALLMQEAGF